MGYIIKPMPKPHHDDFIFTTPGDEMPGISGTFDKPDTCLIWATAHTDTLNLEYLTERPLP